MDRERIQVELVRLTHGRRVLRLVDARSSLAMEKMVDAAQPLQPQKERLWPVFEAALAQAAAEEGQSL
jgi:hypothetical protein